MYTKSKLNRMFQLMSHYQPNSMTIYMYKLKFNFNYDITGSPTNGLTLKPSSWFNSLFY